MSTQITSKGNLVGNLDCQVKIKWKSNEKETIEEGYYLKSN